ncbi:unnamed protein product [Didymodactylos carnosus]|uniref:PX domain-containing protein n=1 Tax=Didymodactylos carnosus TaxID=1234261 RepID=A0A8S2IB50_9BILA|nr:unnamed protein product [Didymodactylos carnosus]CAF3735557.1 unnamed protein product [Didymodactylos carnosus]
MTSSHELSTFDVPETKRHQNGHTIYKIVLQVTPNDLAESPYELVYWKRYTEIRDLYEILHRYHIAVYRPGKFPPFPEKSRFNEKFKPSVIEERRLATREFLNFALERLHLRTHDAYKNFFQNGEKVLLSDQTSSIIQPTRIWTPNLNEQQQEQQQSESFPTVEKKTIVDEHIVGQSQPTPSDVLIDIDDDQLEKLTKKSEKIIDDLADLQFDQQVQLKEEQDEFISVENSIDEAMSLLVTASKNDKQKYSYNTISVVLFTEIVKLIAAIFLYRKNHSFVQMKKEVTENKMLIVLYFVPSIMYCLYNNLAFVNLSAYDPTTYFLLLQFRVVVTGVIFQCLFHKRLTRMQWLSLVLLTCGCIIKQLEYANKSTDSSSIKSTISPNSVTSDTLLQDRDLLSYTQKFSFLNINLLFILIQVFCSCFAGVYNEYLLKDRGVNIDIMLQNIYMYADSILCNFVLLAHFDQQEPNIALNDKLTTTFSIIFQKQPLIFLIILNNACIGIVTSLFLKAMDAILKTFASALELLFTGLLAWLLFSIPISFYTFIAILVVACSIYLYSLNPVHNPPKMLNSGELPLSNSTIMINEQEKKFVV